MSNVIGMLYGEVILTEWFTFITLRGEANSVALMSLCEILKKRILLSTLMESESKYESYK